MKLQLLSASKIVLITFIASSIIMIAMKKIAYHIDALDRPTKKDGGRHIHKQTVPKLGAVGIFLAFLLGYMIFGEQSLKMNAILIGSFIIILVSIVDDIKPIKAGYKLIGHFLAASTIAIYGNILLDNISFLGITIDFGILTYPITILFLIACSNIINLIDGMDGESSGICSIFFATIIILCFYQGRFNSLVLILSLIMLGSTLGFLLHNFHPASIFAGDGATFLGFIIGVITLLEFKGPALISFFIPISVLGIPILDTFFAIIRRLLKKEPPFKADKEHIHHQLLGMKLSVVKTVLIIYLIEILFASASLIYTIVDPIIGKIIYSIIFVIVLWFVIYTSIITDKNPKFVKKVTSKLKIKK